MAGSRNLPPSLKARPRTPPAAPTPAPPAAPDPVTLVLVVHDERIAHILRNRARAFVLFPHADTPISLRVIVDAGVLPARQGDLQLVSYLAELGADLDDLNAIATDVQVGWPNRKATS